jgi:hypothetical protein
VRFSRSLKLADVKGDKVTLRQTFALPAENIAGVRVAEDRVYLSRYARYDHAAGVVSPNGTYKMPPLLDPGGLWAIGGIRAGELSIVSSMSGDSRWPLAARGTKVALYTDGGLAIYDTAAATPTLVRSVDLRGWGYTSHVLMGEDRAICSLGEWGMQSVKY